MVLSESLNHMLEKSLSLTNEPKDIAMLIASIVHQSEPSPIKVDLIKEAIQTNQYQLHLDLIAEKMLEFVSSHNKHQCAEVAPAEI